MKHLTPQARHWHSTGHAQQLHMKLCVLIQNKNVYFYVAYTSCLGSLSGHKNRVAGAKSMLLMPFDPPLEDTV